MAAGHSLLRRFGAWVAQWGVGKAVNDVDLDDSLQAITDIARDRAPDARAAVDRLVRAVRHGGTGPDAIAWTTARCTALVQTLLLGGPPPDDLAAQLAVVGIDPDREYLAFRARPGRGNHSGYRLPDGFAVPMGGDLAGFVSSPPGRLGGLLVGLGPARTPLRLAESFHLATRALDTIEAFGLRGVHSFEALGLRPAVLADPDVQSSLRHRYLDRLGGHDAVPELLSTLRLYFACGMRVDRTAERMSLHRNTLRHRIARFEKLTGASLRDPLVAMEVWWTLQTTGRRAARPVRALVA